MNTAAFEYYDNHSYKNFTSRPVFIRDLTTLAGIINGIDADSVITPKEIAQLENWMSGHMGKNSVEPYKSVIATLKESLLDRILTNDEKDNILWLCEQFLSENGYFASSAPDIQYLSGIVQGIAIDNIINDQEIKYLDLWLESNRHLRNCWPYDELYNILTRILSDRVVTSDEHNELLHFCKMFDSSSRSNKKLLEILKTGMCQVDPEITIQEKVFCMTGISRKYKRREIAERIELFGGIVKDNVTLDLDYLVVCDDKNSCWAFTCYGRKVEKAVEYRRSGVPLAIIHEFDLNDTIESMTK